MTSARPPEVPKASTSRKTATLDQLYGAIGISAVAAALRYCGRATKPAKVPAESPVRNDADDIAA